MAIIYTYPTKATLALADTVLISDSADANKTKNATITSIKDAIDVVDSITATSPLVASASTGAVTLSIPAATSGANGYLASSDWSTFNGKQGELLSGVNIKTINSNPILGSGDLVISGAAANPAGANTQLQYNNNGSFGASDFLSFANRTLSLGKAASSAASQLNIYGGGSDDGKLTIYCSAGTHGVTIEGPDHTGGSDYTLKLPASLPSVANQILESNASGALSWIATPTGGSGGPGTGTQYTLPIWATTSTLGDSLITQNSTATVLTIGTDIASFSTVAGQGSAIKTQLAINGYTTSGGKLELKSPNGATYAMLEGPANGGTAYSIKMPNAVGTANQVLKLPSTIPGSGASQLVWGDATGASYVAGDGLNLTGNTFRTDLKANGGLVIESTELAVDLSASSITGTLAVADGGTGITAIGQYGVLVGTSNTAVERSSTSTGAIQLPSGTTSQAPTGVNGMLRYDTTTNKLMVYEGGYWKNITTAMP